MFTNTRHAPFFDITQHKRNCSKWYNRD